MRLMENVKYEGAYHQTLLVHLGWLNTRDIACELSDCMFKVINDLAPKKLLIHIQIDKKYIVIRAGQHRRVTFYHDAT